MVTSWNKHKVLLLNSPGVDGTGLHIHNDIDLTSPQVWFTKSFFHIDQIEKVPANSGERERNNWNCVQIVIMNTLFNLPYM